MTGDRGGVRAGITRITALLADGGWPPSDLNRVL